MVVSLTYKELLQVSKLPFLFTVVWEKAAFYVHCSVGEIWSQGRLCSLWIPSFVDFFISEFLKCHQFVAKWSFFFYCMILRKLCKFWFSLPLEYLWMALDGHGYWGCSTKSDHINKVAQRDSRLLAFTQGWTSEGKGWVSKAAPPPTLSSWARSGVGEGLTLPASAVPPVMVAWRLGRPCSCQETPDLLPVWR